MVDYIKNPPGVDSRTIEPIILAQNVTSSGPTIPVQIGLTKDFNMYAHGTFDGATILPEFSLDNVNFGAFPINGVSLTFTELAVQYFFKLDAAVHYRLVVTGAGASTDITVELR